MNATDSLDPLIGAIKNRDRDALNQFLGKHRDRLRDWVRFRLGVPSGRGADHSDALQDVSIRIWQLVETFEGTTEAQFLCWFQQRLRWWVVDLSRKKILGAARRDSHDRFSMDDEQSLSQLPADIGSPSHCAAQSEKEALIRGATRDLTNEQMAVLLLHDVDGVSLKEIARQYEVNAVEIARQYTIAADVLNSGEMAFDDAESDRHEQLPAARLASAFQRLSAIERHAILLKHLEHFTMEEAASALGTTPAAIGSAVYRGMKRLKTLLGQHLSAEGGFDAKRE